MLNVQTWSIATQDVKTLCWCGDSLIDWADAGTTYRLDGSRERGPFAYRYHFDAACMSPSGEYAVLYEKLGTKGLVLHRSEGLREINRSFYYANAYEYPITLFRLPNGREVMAHCPQDYWRLEIEDTETGERLTPPDDSGQGGFFVSRLAANSAGTMLLAMGWFWSPIDGIGVLNVEALLDPHWSGGVGVDLAPGVKDFFSSAAFLGEHGLVVVDEDNDYEDGYHPSAEEGNLLAVYDLQTHQERSKAIAKDLLGILMPVGPDFVIGFYDHPKLVRLADGEIVHQWPELNTGKQLSTIIWGAGYLPPLALDPLNKRFAVATKTSIEIVQVQL